MLGPPWVSAVKVEAGAARDLRPRRCCCRIRASAGLSSVTVDETRFPGFDNRYQSPDYETAPNKVDIDIETGVGSVSVIRQFQHPIAAAALFSRAAPLIVRLGVPFPAHQLHRTGAVRPWTHRREIRSAAPTLTSQPARNTTPPPAPHLPPH